jgi:hypothetical protein
LVTIQFHRPSLTIDLSVTILLMVAVFRREFPESLGPVGQRSWESRALGGNRGWSPQFYGVWFRL